MCPECRAEYDDPADRRFHAQPNACPVCGPRCALIGADAPRRAERPGRRPSPRLRAGAIVAVKGIGGYHLACRADDERAVAALRARKHREDKPFALMAAVVGRARGAGVARRPRRRRCLPARAADRARAAAPDAPVADVRRARAPELGVMLPYSPLHHLLLAGRRRRRS